MGTVMPNTKITASPRPLAVLTVLDTGMNTWEVGEDHVLDEDALHEDA